MKIVVWFSCGNNSAVAAKLTLALYPSANIRIIRCVVDNEHPDNERFCSDVEQWLDHPVERLRSTKYKDCWDVWERERYLAGVKGAKCTIELKKAIRWQIEQTWFPDFQVFGYSFEEKHRSERLLSNSPELRLLRVLEDGNITKSDCATIILSAGIQEAAMYQLGFKNNNCIGCVKSTSPAYWARVRYFFPEIFDRMAELSRCLNVRMLQTKGTRIFLDELPPDTPMIVRRSRSECGVVCS